MIKQRIEKKQRIKGSKGYNKAKDRINQRIE